MNSKNPFGHIAKMLEQFDVPGLDISSMTEARRRDIDALVAANRTAVEGMQAMAKKQIEIFEQAMRELQAASEEMADRKNSGPDAAKLGELARSAWQKALADMRELAELARRSQTDAIVAISERATQHMQELRRSTQPG